MNSQFDEWLDQKPKEQPHHILKSLKRSERWTIRLVYYKNWRKFVKNSRLSTNQSSHFKIYFHEVHARYYLTVVKGGAYVTVARLIKNFFLSKVNENLRAVLSSLEPYNLTAFVHGIRSQIEINALLNKFIKDPTYHEKYILLNEDRRRIKELPTTINVNTLVDGLDSDIIPYQEIYHSLSLLLHPNPSAVKFYAQAEPNSPEGEAGIAKPGLSFYFFETIEHSASASKWFSQHVWAFLACIEHFLILFDAFKNEFHLDEDEKKQHYAFAMAEFVAANQKEILSALNKAAREGTDKQEAINKIFENLLKKGK